MSVEVLNVDMYVRGLEAGRDAYFEAESCFNDDSSFVQGWAIGYGEAEDEESRKRYA